MYTFAVPEVRHLHLFQCLLRLSHYHLIACVHVLTCQCVSVCVLCVIVNLSLEGKALILNLSHES